jgi:SAM-dependent methyltransferase
MAHGNGAFDVREGQLPDEIPFEPGGFDLVAALDVLEHVDQDLKSMRALWSQLRPGGWALITVPAFAFLWSRHDERHHHKRRYARDELVARIRAAGLSPVFVTYFNSVLFPVIAGVRVLKNALRLTDVEDDKMPAQLVNRTLRAVFASERHLVGRLPLPFGVSLLVVARKAEA